MVFLQDFILLIKSLKKKNKQEKDVTDDVQMVVPSAPVYPVTPPYNSDHNLKPVAKLVLSTE